MGLETIFWPSLECRYWGTRSYTPRTHRAPGAEVEGWEGSNLGAFGGSGDQERWARQQFHRKENFLPREGSGAGPSRGRPPLRSLTVTSLCARTVHPAASARGASRRGPRAGLGSTPARRRSAGTPGSDRPASIARKGRRRLADPSIPAGRQPSPAHPAWVFVPPATGVSPGRPSTACPGGLGAPGVAPALFGQRGAGRRTLTVHPSEEKQEPRRPPPRRLFCAPATGHTHGRWRERGDGGGGGAGARRRRRRRAPGCSLRAPRRRRGRGGASRARSLPPALRRPREPLAGRPSRGQGRAARASGRRQDWRLRGSGLALHNQPPPPPARLSASRHRRSSVHSAIPWPACLGSRPALPWTRPGSRGFRRAWSPSSEAVPIDVRAHERRPLGSRGTGARVPGAGVLRPSSAAVPGLV